MIRKDTNCLYYLLHDYNSPDWFPYCLFDISDNALPPYWHVRILDKKESTGTIFYLSGFKELCDAGYHDSLIEREK